MYIFWLVVILPFAVAAPLVTPHESTLIEGKYIVKFHAGVSLTWVDDMKSRISNPPDLTFSFGDFTGLAGTLTEKEVDMVKQMDSVEYVQQNAAVHTQDWLVQEYAPWGLGRISHVEKGNSSYVFDSSSGEGTCAYIIDTGIFVDHPDFEGRAEWLENLSGDGVDSDGNGHGTHVAGIIGASTYGVAKKTKLFAVKVLDANGSGTIAGVIAGVNFVVNDAKTRDCPKGVVVNMSLGGGKNPATNDAVASAIKSGLFISVAAGNSNSDAARFSPASEPTACTVGSVDVADTKSPSSNFGPLVDVYAPGVQIKSTWNDGSTNTISGTSMAAPHIAGLGAYLLALEKDTSTRTLCERIVELANEGKISGLPSGTANRLAFNGAPSIYN